jgi:hypothetical protein
MSALTVLRADVIALCVGLGYKTAASWNKKRMNGKLKDLAELVSDDPTVAVGEDVEDHQRLNGLLKRIGEAGGVVEVVQELPEETPEEMLPDDGGDSDPVEMDEQEDGADSEEEVVEPKKNRKQSKEQRQADREASSKDKSKKSGDKPGVIASIIEFYRAASEETPIDKDSVLAKLAKRFPDREKEAMAKTVQAQTPARILKEKKIEVLQNEKGRWIAG